LKQSKPNRNPIIANPKMRVPTLLLLAAPAALSNLIARQESPSVTPTVLSITETVIAVTETLGLGDGPFASLDSIPGCSIAPSVRRLLDSAPRPGTKLRSELASASIANYCGFQPTATLLSVDYSAYTSELATWYEANSAALGSFEASFTSSCTVVRAAITSAVLACVSDITAEAASMATGTAGASTTNATTTVAGVKSTAGAAAEGAGLVGAVGAVAGMVALVAAL
jgi:hypothetical protein